MNKYLIIALLLVIATANAQMAKGSKKFLGNITTSYVVRTDFLTYWNQITGENECKWQSVENVQNVMQWDGCDRVYKYAKDNKIPFKFHTLVWGSQYPGFDDKNPGTGWFDKLSSTQQLKEITEWMDAASARYPDADLIDVVNEAVQGHATGIQYWKESLGGNGTTGYDWIIKAFQMARTRWPKAVLVYNDFNVIRWDTEKFITLVNTIKQSGYVDAVGFQSHGLEDLTGAELKTQLDYIHGKIQLPIYISEYDLAFANDTDQKNKLAEQFPVLWETDYIAGVTMWGYVNNKTWVANTGLLTEAGAERASMAWLKTYMSTHLNVPSAFDWSSGGLSTGPKFTTPSAISLDEQTALVATLEATVVGGGAITYSIKDGVDATLFTLEGATHKLSFKAAPLFASPTDNGANNVYEVNVQASSGGKSTILSMKITITQPRAPYNGTALSIPGKIEAEEYDFGGEGKAYHESDTLGNQGKATLRPNDQVDIETTGDTTGAYNIGYTMTGEWLMYTVDVKSTEAYNLNVRVATNGDSKTMHVEIDGTNVSGAIAVPNTGDWQTWQTVTIPNISLTAGQHDLKVVFDSDYINLNWLEFSSTTPVDVELPVGIVGAETSSHPQIINSESSSGIQILWQGDFNYKIIRFDGILAEAGKGNNHIIVGHSLTPGLYILRVQNAVGAMFTQKLVKQ